MKTFLPVALYVMLIVGCASLGTYQRTAIAQDIFMETVATLVEAHDNGNISDKDWHNVVWPQIKRVNKIRDKYVADVLAGVEPEITPIDLREVIRELSRYLIKEMTND